MPGNSRSAAVDLDTIRSHFIQENLERALEERDRERARRTALAFRHYFEWFKDRLPELEKKAIARQLSMLERSCSSMTG